ncbi:hypothetical protein DAPPUDRAFT_316456 [Daphnia pulex]|uniref:Uncharacterized protein n=1 Tax=Daphnia pulex TaxID=6669 RepID=E9GCZ6_DAPPU|nr:hypothetical protein DAPPUDRAFT_316456 [Daphnia pulex]|eukprot:EFX82775.1 hypothetical protein DAPPUDRAFT_316456 [Daphnia pulex]
MAEGRLARQNKEKWAVEAFVELKEKFPLNELCQLQDLENVLIFGAVGKLLEDFLLGIFSDSLTAWTAKRIVYTMWFSVVSADLRKFIRDQHASLRQNTDKEGVALLNDFELFKIMKGSFLRLDFFPDFPWFHIEEIDFVFWTNKWVMEEGGAREGSLNSVDDLILDFD